MVNGTIWTFFWNLSDTKSILFVSDFVWINEFKWCKNIKIIVKIFEDKYQSYLPKRLCIHYYNYSNACLLFFLTWYLRIYVYIYFCTSCTSQWSGLWVNKELKLKINCTIGILKNAMHVYFGNELYVKISWGSSSRRTHAGIIRYVIGVDNFHVGVCGLQTNSFGTPWGLLMPADADQIVCP